MTDLKQLDREDVMYIAGETPQIYQHTAGVLLLDSSDSRPLTFERLKKRLIERLEKVPRFRWKLHQVPLGLDLPYWVEDENFSYDHHIRRIAAPSPGDRQALAEVVAHLYSQHMDRDKPLWEFWFIEGLADGKTALLQKFHHCLMDGGSAMRLSDILFDRSPRARARPVDPHISNASAGAVPDAKQLREQTTRTLARLPLEIYRGLDELLRPQLLAQLTWWKRDKVKRPPVPRAMFNAAITRERALVFASLPVEHIREVKTALGVSFNDVVMALVGTSLREYLMQRESLPEESLRAIIAISLHTGESGDFANRVTNTPVTLGTDIEDPLRRLQAIHAESSEAVERARASGSGKGIVDAIQHLPPLLVNAIVQGSTAEQAPDLLGANLAVSNMRGSEARLYVAGAKIEAMYPMSIIGQGLGINVTCLSYAGSMDFGLTLAPELCPEPWALADGLDRALAQYRKLV